MVAMNLCRVLAGVAFRNWQCARPTGTDIMKRTHTNQLFVQLAHTELFSHHANECTCDSSRFRLKQLAQCCTATVSNRYLPHFSMASSQPGGKHGGTGTRAGIFTGATSGAITGGLIAGPPGALYGGVLGSIAGGLQGSKEAREAETEDGALVRGALGGILGGVATGIGAGKAEEWLEKAKSRARK